jgi:hypothetical protein
MILQYDIRLQNTKPKFHHDPDYIYGHLMKQMNITKVAGVNFTEETIKSQCIEKRM